MQTVMYDYSNSLKGTVDLLLFVIVSLIRVTGNRMLSSKE